MRKSKGNFNAGTRYGRLVLTGNSESRKTKSGTIRVQECKCDCGNAVWIARANLTKKNPTQSCGCLQREVCGNRLKTHGMTQTRLYGIYSGMITRCTNPKDKTFKNYGARGIKVLRNSFEDFCREMGPSYEQHVKECGEKDTTIERIDLNGNYCKENCTRKTKKEQVNNQRSNTVVIINGEQHNLGEWSKILGIPRETLKRHIIKGKIKGEIYNKGTGKMYNYKQSLRS